MTWKPASKEEIFEYINNSLDYMNVYQKKLWELIKINPEKWKQHPWGDEGGGFWVVAIIGKQVIWYNDIEDGFNQSTYSDYGEIDTYYSNQDGLQGVIYDILNEINNLKSNYDKFGEPERIDPQ